MLNNLLVFLKKIINFAKERSRFNLPGSTKFVVPGLPRRWPTLNQWARLPQVFSQQEEKIFLSLLCFVFILVFSLAINNYYSHTQIVPDAGGQYREGMIGQPRYLNPVLAQTNDVDRDLVQLIYSGLLKYDGQGTLVPDLAEKYTISDDSLTYDFFLRKDIQWHDEELLTADDVVFTIKTIQNPEYKSPLKVNWNGVEVEKVDQLTVRFKLKNIYAPFCHNLTVGILPRHLWAGISAQNFPLAEYNLKPIGSGPYQFKKFDKDKLGTIQSIELEWHEDFYLQKPFIKELIFKFYQNEEEAIQAVKKHKTDGLASLSASHLADLEENNWSNGLIFHRINLPRYYAVFFNQTESKALADKTVRLALAHATNKQEIIEQILNSQAQPVDSPLLSGWLGYSRETDIYNFALEHAQNILAEAGWTDEDEDGIREKGDDKLEITLITTEWPELVEAANLLKKQWERIGAKINLQVVSFAAIQQDFIRPRAYQALLFGEVLGADPDPFAFWHSSQKRDPGLNLSLYNNGKVDKLLEEARQSLDKEVRAAKYQEFQKLLVEDLPAIFLYSPTYIYPVNKKIKGISIERLALPSQRFCQVESWYIKTDRAWK